jgi:uncharacterized membrane protein
MHDSSTQFEDLRNLNPVKIIIFWDMTSCIVWQLLGTTISAEYAASIFISWETAILILVDQSLFICLHFKYAVSQSYSPITMPLFVNDRPHKLFQLQ